jgi:peptidoglycan/xylan/chitin deacetylase (PgdA/CDA1 family)
MRTPQHHEGRMISRAIPALKPLLTGMAALLLCGAAPVCQPEIAITIDDLPVHAPYRPGVAPLAVNRQMVAALKAGHVPATAFVNAVNVKDADTMEALRDWRRAGFTLGNHTWSHPHLSALTVPQFEDELTKDEPILSKLGRGSDWRWFRYPFLDEGKDEKQRLAARAVLRRHGYRIAGVTMSFSDWAFTGAYARCSAAHNAAGVAMLERLYLQTARENLAATRGNAPKLYGHDIPYVLLMHVSAMSAHLMPEIVRLYRHAGVRLVSLAQAERGAAYAGYTDLRLPPPSSFQTLARDKNVQLTTAPDYTAEINAACT